MLCYDFDLCLIAAELVVPANHVLNTRSQSLLFAIGQKVRAGSLDPYSGPFRRGLCPTPRTGKIIDSDYPLLTASTDAKSEKNFLFTLGKLTLHNASLNPPDPTASSGPYFNFHDPNGQYSKNISKAPPVGPLAVKMLLFASEPLGILGSHLRACMATNGTAYAHELFEQKYRV